MSKSQPYFSIITSTKSAGITISQTINSINNSRFDNYEWLVIDCLSKDSTIEQLKSKAKNLTYLVSECDSGIYDAWNKALAKASGEWILFLGAGDILLEDALSNYYDHISNINIRCNFICSTASLMNDKGIIIRDIGKPLKKEEFRRSMKIVHAGAIHHKSLFSAENIFTTKFKSSSDYEFLLRRLDVIIPSYMNKITVKLLDGGISTNFNGLIETFTIQKQLIGGTTAYFNFMVASIKFFIRKFFYKFKII